MPRPPASLPALMSARSDDVGATRSVGVTTAAARAEGSPLRTLFGSEDGGVDRGIRSQVAHDGAGAEDPKSSTESCDRVALQVGQIFFSWLESLPTYGGKEEFGGTEEDDIGVGSLVHAHPIGHELTAACPSIVQPTSR